MCYYRLGNTVVARAIRVVGGRARENSTRGLQAKFGLHLRVARENSHLRVVFVFLGQWLSYIWRYSLYETRKMFVATALKQKVSCVVLTNLLPSKFIHQSGRVCP